MSASQHLLFFKEWASYLKKAQVQSLEMVLRHVPASPTELAFLLEITSQLSMLHALKSSPHSEFLLSQQMALPQFNSSSSVSSLLTKQYIKKLIVYHTQLQSRQTTSLSSILIEILVNCNSLAVAQAKRTHFGCLQRIGKLYYLLISDSSDKKNTILKESTNKWMTRRLLGNGWKEPLANLLVLWSANHAKNGIMLDGKIRIEEHSQILLDEWFESVQFILHDGSIRKQFSEQDILSFNHQCKNMAKSLKLKSHKDRRLLLVGLKEKILERCQFHAVIGDRSIILGYCLALIHSLCSQSQQRLQNVITQKDLIICEQLFYQSFWQLQRMDILQYFAPLSLFMRTVSQCNILSIYQKISLNFSPAATAQIITEDVSLQIQSQNMLIYKQFVFRPITTAKAVLDHYLRCSGIPLPKTLKKLTSKQTRDQTITPPVVDPLHFMMIANRYWHDNFHRDVLEVALWMSLDSYSKWVERHSSKETSEKQMQEYIKKLNIAVAIFFFSLQHPTRLLQYQPVESDCLKELFVQAVFPSIVLGCKFFFQSYNWQTRTIISKTENGLEGWVIPWGHLLTIPKNMVHFIYLERGYELAHRIVAHNRLNFDRTFGDFFVSKILSELQGLGINLGNNEAQTKQKLMFLSAERKKFMTILLRESEKGGEKGTEKTSHTARRILQILC